MRCDKQHQPNNCCLYCEIDELEAEVVTANLRRQQAVTEGGIHAKRASRLAADKEAMQKVVDDLPEIVQEIHNTAQAIGYHTLNHDYVEDNDALWLKFHSKVKALKEVT